jgi:hypothetical protein
MGCVFALYARTIVKQEGGGSLAGGIHARRGEFFAVLAVAAVAIGKTFNALTLVVKEGGRGRAGVDAVVAEAAECPGRDAEIHGDGIHFLAS